MHSIATKSMFLLLSVVLLGCYDSASAQYIFPPTVYCARNICGKENLACQNVGNLSSECLQNSTFVPMAKYKDLLLNLFNSFRNQSAAGITRRAFAAGRMGRMSWSNELETFAKLDLSRCLRVPRPCMASPNFPRIGSVIDGFSYGGSENNYKNFACMRQLYDGWMEDVNYLTRKQIVRLTDSFRTVHTAKLYLMMIDSNNFVGCSAMRSNMDDHFHFHFACAFARTLALHKPVYAFASRPGTRCKYRDATYSNLCSVKEKYVYDENFYEFGEIIPIK